MVTRFSLPNGFGHHLLVFSLANFKSCAKYLGTGDVENKQGLPGFVWSGLRACYLQASKTGKILSEADYAATGSSRFLSMKMYRTTGRGIARQESM